MKRDKTHLAQIERWANCVKKNKDWKSKLKPFLDSQVIIARRSYKKILNMPDGKSRVKTLKKIS